MAQLPFADLTNVVPGPHAPQPPPIIQQAQGATAEQALLYDKFKKSILAYHGMPVQELMSLCKKAGHS